MPVEKFRSVEEMPRPARVNDERLIEHIRKLWNRAFALAPPSFSRGVTRFRSIEMANQAREDAVHERMRRLASVTVPRGDPQLDSKPQLENKPSVDGEGRTDERE
jgi:hypothetical protein